jgi:hypothetical protein
MDKLSEVIDKYSVDMDAIQKFSDDIYDENFAENFEEVRELYKRMKSKVHPITDEELEYILTVFPMELFSVAERLNKIRLNCEVVKLKNKETLEAIRSAAIIDANQLEMNKTQTADYVNRKINTAMVEYEVLHAAYVSIVTRVENEQTFAKELIMGAKKVWDSRRSADNSNPVGLVVPELPEYTPTKSKTPIY